MTFKEKAEKQKIEREIKEKIKEKNNGSKTKNTGGRPKALKVNDIKNLCEDRIINKTSYSKLAKKFKITKSTAWNYINKKNLVQKPIETYKLIEKTKEPEEQIEVITDSIQFQDTPPNIKHTKNFKAF